MVSFDICRLCWQPQRSNHWCHRAAAVLCIIILVAPLVLGEEYHLDDEHSKIYYRAEIKYTYRDPKRRELVTNYCQGKFGTNLTKVKPNVTGKVVHVTSVSKTGRSKTDHFGCWNYTMAIPSVKWIALVERGECAFTTKLRTATITNNASAVVIYDNDTNEDTLIRHEDLGSNVAVIIPRDKGLTLAKLLDSGVVVDMEIQRGQQQVASPNGNVNNSSVLFVSISFITIVFISVAWLMFYYIRKFRYSHAKERLAKRLVRAAKKAIAKIPQRTINAGDKELEGDFDQCAVCIEPYKDGDIIRLMPCRHVFHKSCVDPWLLDHRTCPMCKLDILQAYGMSACKLDILRAYGIQGSEESMHRDEEGVTGMLESIPSVEGGTRSPSSALILDDNEASSSLEDETHDTSEVKVVLVPHSCLHYHHSRASDGRQVGVLEEDEEDMIGDEAEASTGLLTSSNGADKFGDAHGSRGSINSRGSGDISRNRSKSHDKAMGCKTDSNKNIEMEALIPSAEEEGEVLCSDSTDKDRDGASAQIEDDGTACASKGASKNDIECQSVKNMANTEPDLSAAHTTDDACGPHVELKSESHQGTDADTNESDV